VLGVFFVPLVYVAVRSAFGSRRQEVTEIEGEKA
jgi:hypothetical protein